jgi:hypothetical protein
MTAKRLLEIKFKGCWQCSLLRAAGNSGLPLSLSGDVRWGGHFAGAL